MYACWCCYLLMMTRWLIIGVFSKMRMMFLGFEEETQHETWWMDGWKCTSITWTVEVDEWREELKDEFGFYGISLQLICMQPGKPTSSKQFNITLCASPVCVFYLIYHLTIIRRISIDFSCLPIDCCAILCLEYATTLLVNANAAICPMQVRHRGTKQ